MPVTGAVLSTTLPVEVQYVTSDPPGAYDPVAHEVVWSGLSLSTGAHMTATVDMVVKADTELCALMESSSYLFYGATHPVSDSVSFGGLLGEASIMPINDRTPAEPFIELGGRIPAPIHSLKN